MKKAINRITFKTVLKAMPIIIIWVLFFTVPQQEGILNYSVDPNNGLWSIFTGSLFHANYNHIINNTILLLILLPILSRYKEGIKYYIFLFFMYLIPSIAVYIEGVPTVGISGLVYALYPYCIIKLSLEDHYKNKTFTLILLSFWGFSFISGLFPIQPQLSWVAHSSGFIPGALWGIIEGIKINKKTV